MKLTFALVLIICQLFFVTPLAIYASNQEEFSFGFFELTGKLCLIFLLTGLAASWLLRKRSEVLCVLTIALLVCLYVQGNFLVWDYGIFDGHDIRWADFTNRAVIDLSVWCLLLGIALFAKGLINKIAAKILIVVFCLQIFSILQLKVNPWNLPSKNDATASNSQLAELYKFSPQANTIFILLDTFEAPAFSHIIASEPRYRENFAGFTYYRNTLGSFPTTAPSIPAIFTGLNYDNSLPLKEFIQRHFPEEALPSVLSSAGVAVDVVTLDPFCSGLRARNCVSLSRANSENFTKLKRQELLKLLDVVLFRHAPQPLKQLIYNEQQWALQQLLQKRKGPSNHTSSIDFIESLVDKAALLEARHTFKFFQLMIPHLPLRLDAQCEYTKLHGKITPDNYAVQARCGLHLVDKIFTRLKALGIYDSALIVVLADHGYKINYGDYKRPKKFPQLAEALPLLLIKPANSQAPFAVSEVPATLTDLPKTVLSTLGLSHDFPGHSLFELTDDFERERVFRRYSWTHDNWQKEYLPPMQEFLVQGHAWDPQAWQKGRLLEPPKQ